MENYFYKLKKVSVVICIIFASFNLYAGKTTADASSFNIDDAVEQINYDIRKKLQYYDQAFPEIQFVHLKNREWEKSLQALELFIGYQATNLDYEHPVAFREDLLFVTIKKIQMILVNKVASSYLFKVGESPVASRKHVCIITLDPATMVLTDKVATEFFSDLSQDTLDGLPSSAYLDKNHHLDFIIDHEAFHCLDTFYYGGIPMSHKEFFTSHDNFMRENQADMFAIAMHMRRNGIDTPYARNVMMLRGMTLLGGEMQHDSVKSMQLMVRSVKEKAANEQPLDLVKQVTHLYKSLMPGYEEYLDYRVAAVKAIGDLGKQVNEPEKPFAPADRKANEKMVQKLIDRTRDYYRQYVGREYVLPAD